VIGSYPWILSPVGFVLLTVFAFNALGDGLRDAIDPYFGGASMDASPYRMC
jgi:peptide/nickel transport system permease protein